MSVSCTNSGSMLVTVIVLLILSLVGNQFGANLSTRTATNDYGLPSCPGTSSLANITPSPVFERDHTLFFRYDSVLWRSTNDGNTWDAVFNAPEPVGRVRFLSMVSLPNSPALTLYLSYSYSTGRFPPLSTIARSTDGGDTWINRTACDPNCSGADATNQPDTVFATRIEDPLVTQFGKGILRSDDGALTWQVLRDDVNVWRVFVSPAFADDQIVFAGAWAWTDPPPASWLIVTRDGGSSWEYADVGLNSSRIEELMFSPGFANDHTIFAYQHDTLFNSVDAGRHWQPIYFVSGDYFLDLALSPDYAEDHIIFLSKNDALLISYDDGLNWHILVGGGGGHFLYQVVVTRNQSTPPRQMSGTVTPFYAMPSSPSHHLYLPLAGAIGISYRPLTLFLSMTPIGEYTHYFRSDDGGLTWRCLALPPVDD